MENLEASKIMFPLPVDPLELLKKCGGYYECPKGPDGKRTGPLVDYTARYEAPDGQKKQWVGEIYVDFSKVDEYPCILFDFASRLRNMILSSRLINYISVFCGVPLGGYSLADMLGFVCDRRVIKAEKKITALDTADSREKSTLVFDRHKIKPGDQVAIVEDVCHNFSTTNELISLIKKSEGEVRTVICFLNRSLTVDKEYISEESCLKLPVISLVRLPIPEFKQEDPFVSEDIAAGKIVWKPKDNWAELKIIMKQGGYKKYKL